MCNLNFWMTLLLRNASTWQFTSFRVQNVLSFWSYSVNLRSFQISTRTSIFCWKMSKAHAVILHIHPTPPLPIPVCCSHVQLPVHRQVWAAAGHPGVPEGGSQLWVSIIAEVPFTVAAPCMKGRVTPACCWPSAARRRGSSVLGQLAAAVSLGL